jgi:putative nucleotidyltransferase with HDIG domain
LTDPQKLQTALSALPPFPRIGRQVTEALRDPLTPMDAIVSLVEHDVALTTAVLKASNSGLYGRAQRVASVSAALGRLGTSVFSTLVMRVVVKGYVGQSMPKAQLDRCWNHSLACAEISKILAERAGLPSDIAHTSGMLHDLGRFGLAMALPRQYAKLSLLEGFVDVLEKEAELFGTDHTEAGRMLAEHFDLPDEIRMAAGRHHDVMHGSDIDNLVIVSVACATASAVGYSVTRPDRARSLDAVVASAPARLRQHIDPRPEVWQEALSRLLEES